MTRKRTPLAPSATPASRKDVPDDNSATVPPQAETPAQKAAFTRRVRKAASEAAALQTAVAAEIERREALARPSEEDVQAPLDAHGFDPSEYKWLPVKRKPRKDGWTPQRQRQFISALAESGSVEFACMRVQMSPSSAHRLRRSPGAEQFSAAWNVALEHAAQVLLDTAFERAFNGSSEPVFDRDGNRTGTRYRPNDRLLMFLLRAYMPGRFRHAHRDWSASDAALPSAPVPMAQVLERLEPVMPTEPHKLLAPDELEDAVTVAELMDGDLPHYHRGTGDAENPPCVDPAFDARLERILQEDRDRW